ncbi:MAG TPA: CBS domain-containing protein [Patescibacteria group bacterium]|jgi:CBS domain-containing membrane protein|nr:CBS domain-containing protein [Patescibacteria group bacterium]
MPVHDVYKKDAKTIHEGATAKEALSQMIKGDFNSFIVVDKEEMIVGVISVADIAAATVPIELQEHVNLAQSMVKPGFFEQGCQDAAIMLVKDIMRKEFIAVHPDADIMHIAAAFLHRDLQIIPIVDEADHILGVVTRTEIKRALADGMGIPTNGKK